MGPDQEEQEVSKQISVVEKSEVELRNKVDSLRQSNSIIEIEQGFSEKSDGNKSVWNHGAGPCAIIYFINTKTGECVSGHFPEVSEERNTRFTKSEIIRAEDVVQKNTPKGDEIVKPTEGQVKWFNKEMVEGYSSYEAMEEEMRILNDKWGNTSTEVHLFGQNLPAFGEGVEKSKRLTRTALEHNDLTTRIIRLGIPESRIQDHRTLDKDNVDSTLYVPEDRLIYHSLRR